MHCEFLLTIVGNDLCGRWGLKRAQVVLSVSVLTLPLSSRFKASWYLPRCHYIFWGIFRSHALYVLSHISACLMALN